MTFNKFNSEIITALQERFPEREIIECSVIKMNDITLYGLCIKEKDSNAAPTIYLNQEYDDFLDGKDIEDIIDNLADAVSYSDSLAPTQIVNSIDFSWESIKDKLTVRLIDMELNKEFLKTHPYRQFAAGLVLIPEINIDDDYSVLVSNEISNKEKFDKDELLETALRNTEEKYPAALRDITAILCRFQNDNLLKCNNPKLPKLAVLKSDLIDKFGASTLAYTGMLDKLFDLYGDCYVIPSSVHEIIIVDASHDPEELKNMVREGNTKVVTSAELLSNDIFQITEDGLSRIA